MPSTDNSLRAGGRRVLIKIPTLHRYPHFRDDKVCRRLMAWLRGNALLKSVFLCFDVARDGTSAFYLVGRILGNAELNYEMCSWIGPVDGD